MLFDKQGCSSNSERFQLSFSSKGGYLMAPSKAMKTNQTPSPLQILSKHFRNWRNVEKLSPVSKYSFFVDSFLKCFKVR